MTYRIFDASITRDTSKDTDTKTCVLNSSVEIYKFHVFIDGPMIEDSSEEFFVGTVNVFYASK